MSGSSWIVVLASAALIAWVNWYFFFAQRSAMRAPTVGGVQEIEILVRGGYDPGTVRARRGIPIRLIFNRQDRSSCSEEIVIPAFNVRRFLPAFERTAIDITPETAGKYEITCGMSMLHGSLVVED